RRNLSTIVWTGRRRVRAAVRADREPGGDRHGDDLGGQDATQGTCSGASRSDREPSRHRATSPRTALRAFAGEGQAPGGALPDPPPAAQDRRTGPRGAFPARPRPLVQDGGESSRRRSPLSSPVSVARKTTFSNPSAIIGPHFPTYIL